MIKHLTEDMENMEEIMIRTGDRCDIWQDRFIYAMAKAIYDILKWIKKKEKTETIEVYLDGEKEKQWES